MSYVREPDMTAIPVSVIIPLHNKEKSIQRAIRSVLTQTHQDFELIIVDDGSTDLSLIRAKAIRDKRIQILEQKNLGVSVARNNGVHAARFDLAAFLDADDEWDDSFLEKIISLTAIYPDCGLYASSYRIIKPNNKVIYLDLPYSLGSHTLIKDVFFDFRVYYPFNSSSVMASKKLLLDVGGFPEDVRAGEDVITWMKLGLASSIAFINIPLSIYHNDTENRASNTLPPDNIYAPVRYLTKLLDEHKIPTCYRKSAVEYVVKHKIASAKRYIIKKQRMQAFRELWSCRNTKEQRYMLGKLAIISVMSVFFPSIQKRM